MSVVFMATVAFYPKSVIKLPPYFVLLSGRLFSTFIEDVAGYIEKKRGKQDDGNSAEDG